MRSRHHATSVPPSPLDNAFSPAYLAHLREQDETLTAAEAELAGPWKSEPVPGKPGAVAVLRGREPLDEEREHLDVVLIDLREQRNLSRVFAVMRHAVEP